MNRILVCLLLISNGAISQVPLADSISIELPVDAAQKVTGIFHSTRIIQSQSVELLGKGSLDVRILHRFGRLSDGVKELFGLDQASMRMSFDYGVMDWLTVGIGRSTYRKEYDGLVKVRLLQQSAEKGSTPFSLVLVAGAMIRTADEISGNGYKPTAGDRTSFYGQLLAGRKFSPGFSAQLSAALLHMNYVPDESWNNTHLAVGIGLRQKLSKRFALTFDHQVVITGLPEDFYFPLGIGFDIETGGHVFQLHFSNAIGMNERAFLTETTDRFFKGEIRFGFNLSRMF
ncbi:DUF5777 family beta-barrel protein [Flavihumibacter sp. UBA7668]|uniref:DUF5777 family beta-barrel protein n=1 Tax=Flavihumibacter sp. UBA7668 TaxID=1946542 RepID=UPI0025C0C956|nr:DUF5777 family beta-barrel protein [Flavihumibacter sp. UBA7668]